jgi:plastocyanin
MTPHTRTSLLLWSALALLVFGITACDEKLSGIARPSPPAATTPTPLTVTIVPAARTLATAAYTPNPATIASGAKVTWSNTDTSTHDMLSDSGLWDSGRIAPGDHFDFSFPSKGTFPYHCSIHVGMVGTIVVQ